jgi:DNA polymerase-4
VTGPWLVQTARGLSPSPVVAAPYVPRSRGREITFQRDITDWDQVRSEVTRLARQVAAEIAGERRQALRVVVKVRYKPFLTHTHGHPLPAATVDAAAIERAALAALDRFPQRRPVRLLGVRAELTR